MLIDYKLADPITRLTLLIQRHPTKAKVKPIKTISYDRPEVAMISDLVWLVRNYQPFKTSFTWKEYRQAIFNFAKQLNRSEHIDKDSAMVEWTGEYYPELRSALINTHTNGAYYLQMTKDEKGFHIYHTNYEDSDRLVDLVLFQSRKLSFAPNAEAFDALRDFWVAQADIDTVTVAKPMNQRLGELTPALVKVLDHVITDKSTDNRQRKYFQESITYQALFDFYHEIQNHKVTNQTKDVQNWLFSSDDITKSVEDILKVLKLHENYATFVKSIADPIEGGPRTELIHQFQKDSYFNQSRNQKITIYPIHQPKKHYHDDKNVQHFIGVHGTNSFSIPSILCDGLKTMHELKNDKDAQFEDTARSLGDGTYFARLDQVTKALSYTNGSTNCQYLLIADISYTKAITRTQYGLPDEKDYDFIKAPSVGISHGYDEYVAVNPQQQVQLKYLVELKTTPKDDD